MILSLPEHVKTIMQLMRQAGYEIYLVGGVVRDFILNLNNTDFDFTTNAKPDEIQSVFRNYKLMDYGIKHGTVGIYYKGNIYEITTYREEAEYSDGRRPDSVKFVTDLKSDLSRRDFTVNAMAADYDGNIIDYFGGLDDFELKLIRCVGDPDARFQEDGLRILRAIRFSLRLNFTLELNTLLAIKNNGLLLERHSISGERIQHELSEIMMYTSTCFDLLHGSNLISLLFGLNDPNLITDLIANSKNAKNDLTLSWVLLAYYLKLDNTNIRSIFAKYTGFGKIFEEIVITMEQHIDSTTYLLEKYSLARMIRHISNSTSSLIKYPNFQIEEFIEKLFSVVSLLNEEEILVSRQSTKDIVSKCLEFPISGHNVKNLGFEGKRIGLVLRYLQILNKYLEDKSVLKEYMNQLKDNSPVDLDNLISVVTLEEPMKTEDEYLELFEILDILDMVNNFKITCNSQYAKEIYELWKNKI